MTQIARIKSVLRLWGDPVDDLPDDIEVQVPAVQSHDATPQFWNPSTKQLMGGFSWEQKRRANSG